MRLLKTLIEMLKALWMPSAFSGFGAEKKTLPLQTEPDFVTDGTERRGQGSPFRPNKRS